jgi:uncharacterized iron-regulated membrane protein
MRLSFLTRKWHRWFALFVGIQALFWMISGVYMVTINLDYIHGDHLVKRMDEPLDAELDEIVPFDELVRRVPSATSLDLVSWLGLPHYRANTPEGTRLFDAKTGDELSPIDAVQAQAVAEYHYALPGKVEKVALLEDEGEKPTEIQARPLPLWQVTFDDPVGTTFYISPGSGQLVTKRHEFWRIFDFVWMFHIMDYEERADMNNNLLRVVALLGTILSLSGFWLLFYSFRKKKKNKVSGETA